MCRVDTMGSKVQNRCSEKKLSSLLNFLINIYKLNTNLTSILQSIYHLVKKIKIKMNPLKQKHPTKNKLLSRFNISMNGRVGQQGNQTLRLNSSKQREDNVSRYRNHISFLQCRIQQQQAAMEKLYCQIDVNNHNQAKLSSQVLRLQRQNQALLSNLYKTQNKVTMLEEKHNNSLLDRSIKKIEYELNMSQVRKRNKTLQDLQVQPIEKSVHSNFTNLKSMKTSQWLESQQPSFKITPPSFLKIIPRVYELKLSNIFNPESPTKKVVDKNEAGKVGKLQQAIYFLKKQLKQKQKHYEQKISSLNIQLQKSKAFTEQKNNKKKKEEVKSDILKQLQQKIKVLEQKLEQKDRQIIKIQQIYSQSLKQAEQMSNQLNTSIKQIMDKKQVELEQTQMQVYECQQKIKRLQKQVADSENTIKQKQQQIEEISYENNQLQEQVSQLTLLNEQCDQNNELFPIKPIRCKQLQIQNVLELAQLSVVKKQDKQLQVDDYQNYILEEKNNLYKKIEQQETKYANQCKKVLILQQTNKQLCKNEVNSMVKIQKLTEQIYEQTKQAQKLKSTIRKYEGQVAQKQQIVTQMTEHMLLIKQKLQTQKQDTYQQCQPISQNIEQKQQNTHMHVEKQDTLNIQSLEQHFSQILAEKQQQKNHLEEVLEKQQNLCEQLQKQLKQSEKKIYDYQLEVNDLNLKIDEFKEILIRYESDIKDNKAQIDKLKKNILQLEEQKQFFQDYINKLEKGQNVF